MDELFTSWRQRHALMVRRMIGAKIGTGGSSGHKYLHEAADKHKIFSDLQIFPHFLFLGLLYLNYQKILNKI